MSELYQNLLNRYKNRSYWIDDYGTMGVILFNEDPFTIKTMWVKYKYSKLSLVNGEYVMDIIAFVKYALSRGYDWRLYGKPEWQEIEPKKKKKFMKPRGQHFPIEKYPEYQEEFKKEMKDYTNNFNENLKK